MKEDLKELEQYRKPHPIFNIMGEGANGFFMIPSPHSKPGKKVILRVLSSNGSGWDHVSVSTNKRNPTWTEMNFIKDLFFKDEETVVQFHPRKTEYVNNHKHCLHLWRNQSNEYDLPQSLLVGIK